MNLKKAYIWLFVASGLLIIAGTLINFLLEWEHTSFVANTTIAFGVSLLTGALIGLFVSKASNMDVKIDIQVSKERIEKMIASNTLRLSFYLFTNLNAIKNARDSDNYGKLFKNLVDNANQFCVALNQKNKDRIIKHFDDRVKDLVIYIENYLDVLPNSNVKGCLKYAKDKAFSSTNDPFLENKIKSYGLVVNKLVEIEAVKELFDMCLKEIKNIIVFLDL